MVNTGVSSKLAYRMIFCSKGRCSSNRSIKDNCVERIIVAVVKDLCDAKIHVVY